MNRCCLLIVSLLMTHLVSASHLLGGYISAKSQPAGPLYQTITVYLTLDEANGSLAGNDLNSISICFGDGTTGSAARISRTRLANDATSSLNIYQVSHIYPGAGRYTLTASLVNRNDDLTNLRGGGGTALGLRTMVLIGAANSTPVLPVLSLDFRPVVNQVFRCSLAATDADGDSLAYILAVPLVGDINQCGTNLFGAGNYLFPNAVQQRGTFKLDPRTGELVWNAPTALGPYVFAMIVEEWRKGQLIGQTGVEQVLTVRDAGGVPVVVPPYEPVIFLPQQVVTGLPDAHDFPLLTFPNPVTDYLTIQWQNPDNRSATLRLFGLDGRLVQAKTTSASTATLDLHTLPGGVYWLVVDCNDRRTARKIVRQ